MRQHLLAALCAALILNAVSTAAMSQDIGGVGDPLSFGAGCHVKEAVEKIGQAMEDGDMLEVQALSEDPENRCFYVRSKNGSPVYGLGIVVELYPHIYVTGPKQFLQVALVHAWNDEMVYTLVPADPLPGFGMCTQCEDA